MPDVIERKKAHDDDHSWNYEEHKRCAVVSAVTESAVKRGIGSPAIPP
ncbi:MAG TPA: hypothetical protein PLZ51_04155 [Aggregatilineales bacterium]|nr:hypothetical protein [Aggregatilineales bacterium]